MADANNTGTSGAPDAMSQGILFQDGPEDIARIGRYEDYLRLQARAGDMTNAEYLEALDAIMKDGDGFDKGDARYGQSGPGSASGLTDAEMDAENERKEARDQEERVRANLEDGPERDPKAGGNAALLDANTEGGPADGTENEPPGTWAGTETGTGAPDGPASGVDVQDEDPEDGLPEEETEEEGPAGGIPENDTESGTDGEPQEGAAEEGSYLGTDPVIHEPSPDGDGNEPAADGADPIAVDADGQEADGATDGYGRPRYPENGTAAPAHTEEAPEPVPQAGPAGAPDEQQPQVVPGAPVALEDEDDGPAPPPAGGTGPVTVPGHVETHTESPKVVDVLDDLSVGLNLMDCVEHSTYVPERTFAPAAEEQPGRPAYRTEKAQQLMDMAERDRQAEPEPAAPDGPDR